jgi:hypothetical protein
LISLTQSATHNAPSLHFELDGIKRSLQEMNGAEVGGDDELAAVPIGVCMSADQEFQGKRFDHKIVCGFKFIMG